MFISTLDFVFEYFLYNLDPQNQEEVQWVNGEVL